MGGKAWIASSLYSREWRTERHAGLQVSEGQHSEADLNQSHVPDEWPRSIALRNSPKAGHRFLMHGSHSKFPLMPEFGKPMLNRKRFKYLHGVD